MTSAGAASRDPPRPLLTTAEALPAVADELPAPHLRRLMLKALVLPVAVMLLLCGLLTLELYRAVELDSLRLRAHAVIAEAHRVQRLVVDQEAALRGYVIDHEDLFLAPLHLGRGMAPAALQRLAALTAEDPEQAAHAAALAAAYERWSAATGLASAAGPSARQVRPGEASRLQLAAREAQLDAVRRGVRDLVDVEEQRLRAEETSPTRRALVGALAAAAALSLVGFTAVVLRRSLRRMEGIYAKALARRRHSEAGERAARQTAEALAAEVAVQTRELQARFQAMRAELELLRAS